MRKQTFWGLLLAGAVSASALAAPALAQPEGPRTHVAHAKGMKGGPHGPMDRMLDRLNLTAEQREKIKALRQQGQSRTKDLHEQLMTKRRELHELVRSADATREQAIAKQREVNALQSQLDEVRMTIWFDMRAVLTPEQLKQFEELKPQRGEPHRGESQKRKR